MARQSQKTLGFQPEQKELVEQATDKLSEEMGSDMDMNATVAYLCKQYVEGST